MADLTEIQSALSTKIIGADSTGLETNPMAVGINGNAKVGDGLKDGGVYGVRNLPTANVAVEAKVGASRLIARKLLIINIESTGVFWGFDSSVTSTSGFPTVNAQVLTFNIDPDSSFQIWLVCSTNNKNTHIAEVP